MFTKRIIPCLDVNNGRVVKGVNFVNLQDAGDPVEIAKAYDKAGADEVVFLDITASSDNRSTVVDMVRKVAANVFIPFTVGGGIRTVDDFKMLLREGADKISINSSAINNPQLVQDAAMKFGSQCVVVAIDAKRREDGTGWNIYKNGGRIDVGIDAVEWAKKVEGLGAGDLRMNPQKGISAAERLKHIDREELIGMLVENSDEPYAEEIAKSVLSRQRKGQEILTTTDLKQTIEEALSFLPAADRREAVKKSCQRTFQALRIDVNSEFEVLYQFLEKLPDVLTPGGRVAILTFHSGEDRLVKKSFKECYKAGLYSEICKDVIRPSAEECVRNSRARSTKMRWAIRA